MDIKRRLDRNLDNPSALSLAEADEEADIEAATNLAHYCALFAASVP